MVKKPFIAFGRPKKPTKYKKSYGSFPSETKNPAGASLPKKNRRVPSRCFTVKKGFNMVKKAFFAFERLKKPWKIRNPAGVNLPKKKSLSCGISDDLAKRSAVRAARKKCEVFLFFFSRFWAGLRTTWRKGQGHLRRPPRDENPLTSTPGRRKPPPRSDRKQKKNIFSFF